MLTNRTSALTLAAIATLVQLKQGLHSGCASATDRERKAEDRGEGGQGGQ